eukprot:1159687-Pelagomonas_calceolata.AAC.1
MHALALQELGLDPSLAALLRASVFELYQLKVELSELLPDLVVGYQAPIKPCVSLVVTDCPHVSSRLPAICALSSSVCTIFGGDTWIHWHCV